jgi:hypothetical protein
LRRCAHGSSRVGGGISLALIIIVVAEMLIGSTGG